MANVFTNPTFVKAKPHASAEKQVGDSDPSARTDVINRVEKGLLAVVKRLFNTITDGVTADFTDLTTTTEFANAPIVPRAVSGTPAQHGLFRENVPKVYGIVTVAGGVPTLVDSFNVTSITDAGVGTTIITMDRDFANATYAPFVTNYNAQAAVYVYTLTYAVGQFYVAMKDAAEQLADAAFAFAVFGDQ